VTALYIFVADKDSTKPKAGKREKKRKDLLGADSRLEKRK